MVVAAREAQLQNVLVNSRERSQSKKRARFQSLKGRRCHVEVVLKLFAGLAPDSGVEEPVRANCIDAI